MRNFSNLGMLAQGDVKVSKVVGDFGVAGVDVNVYGDAGFFPSDHQVALSEVRYKRGSLLTLRDYQEVKKRVHNAEACGWRVGWSQGGRV